MTNLDLCKRFLSGDKTVISEFSSEERLQACVRYWVCKGHIEVDPNLLAVMIFEQNLVRDRKVLVVNKTGLVIGSRTYDWKVYTDHDIIRLRQQNGTLLERVKIRNILNNWDRFISS